jgi:hypothetical protein
MPGPEQWEEQRKELADAKVAIWLAPGLDGT